MHLATLHLAPVLAAEKSKVPFYIAGGVLVIWALVISLAVGMRRPDFPDSQKGENLVIAVSAVLVLITAAMAVVTSGPPSKAEASSTVPSASTPAAAAPTPGGTTAPAAPPKAATGTSGAPKATTGTPAPPSSPAAATKLALAANPEGQLSYNTKQLSAKAGSVTITMANMSPVEHNVTVASGSTVLGATPTFAGGVKTLTVTLKAGTYKFYCSVPGHRQAGMEGTLTVSS
jgi:plastocyanin